MSENLPATTNAKELVQITPIGAILPANVQEAVTISKMLYNSRLFQDVANAEQAFVKIMAGAEMGLPPFASLNGFHIVKGKVMMHYSTIAAGIRRAGYGYRVVEHTEGVCTVEMFDRQGRALGEHSFTIADAKRAGTQNIDKIPKAMLFARCISQAARIYVPEAFNGAIVYSNEERDLIDETSDAPPARPIGTSENVCSKIAVGDHAGEEYDPFGAPVESTIEPSDDDQEGLPLE